MTRPTSRDKVLTHPDAIQAVQEVQASGKTVVFTNGCFDLLHVGHLHSLEEARAHGDHLIVALNSDSSVRSLKGPSRPAVPLSQRMPLVAALACVDWVVSFETATPLALIRELKPDVIAKGGDWEVDDIVGASDVESWGGRVERLSEIEGVRTSEIIRRIRQ
jgi:rfaE bifunctional protein nucleotidyltransferase chain/domain